MRLTESQLRQIIREELSAQPLPGQVRAWNLQDPRCSTLRGRESIHLRLAHMAAIRLISPEGGIAQAQDMMARPNALNLDPVPYDEGGTAAKWLATEVVDQGGKWVPVGRPFSLSTRILNLYTRPVG